MRTIYVTYDVNLKRYLYNIGIVDILYGLHPKTLKPFWAYEKTEDLIKYVDKWNSNSI